MQIVLLRVAILLPLLFWCGLANAQSSNDPSPEFNNWWKLLTGGGNLGPDIDGIALCFDVEHRMPIPSAQEIDAMRQMVEGRPDHPLREQIGQIESVIANGHPVSRMTLWRFDGEWRLARDQAHEKIAYVDSAWANGVAWRLSDRQLVVNNQNAIESSKYRIDASGTDLSTLVSRSMTCMLSQSASQGFDFRPRMAGESQWVLEASMELPEGGTRSIEARGEWNGTAGTVTRSVVIEKDTSGTITSRSTITASDWRPLPGSDLLIAGTASHRIEDNDGTFTMTSTLVSVEPFTREYFRQLVEVPSIEKEDPIRGTVSYVSVTDERGGRQRLLMVQGDGSVEEVSSELTHTQSPTKLRTLGWVVLAALVLVLAWVKFRTTRS